MRTTYFLVLVFGHRWSVGMMKSKIIKKGKSFHSYLTHHLPAITEFSFFGPPYCTYLRRHGHYVKRRHCYWWPSQAVLRRSELLQDPSQCLGDATLKLQSNLRRGIDHVQGRASASLEFQSSIPQIFFKRMYYVPWQLELSMLYCIFYYLSQELCDIMIDFSFYNLT